MAKHQALIIGGGIAGLCVAASLRQIGVESVVVERAPELREIGAGISLWANALRALDHLALGDRVRQAAQRCEVGEFRRSDGRRLMRLDYRSLEARLNLPPTVWMLHREALIRSLSADLPARCLQLGRTLSRVEQAGAEVVATFDDGGTERCDMLIGADGIHSAVRRCLFGPEPVRYAGYTCWRGVAEVPPDVHDPRTLIEIWGTGRRFGITPLPGGRVYWFAVSDEPQGQTDPEPHGAVLARFGSWAAPVPVIVAATPAASIVRHDIIDRPPRDSWSLGRVVLVGDAAHPTTPNLGQGGCMAIEDAPVLANSLRRIGDVEAALAAFVAARRERTARVTRESWSLGRLAQGSTTAMRILRDGLTRLTPPGVAFRRMSALARFDTGPVAAAE